MLWTPKLHINWEGQAGGMLRSSSGRKGHAVASWCWLNPNVLMSSRVPGVVER